MNIEHITNQKEMAFSLLKGGKLQGKHKWLKMAFSGTEQYWKLGSATTVTLLDHGTVPHFKTHIRNDYTQLHKLSTEKGTVIFSPNTYQNSKQCNHHHRNISNRNKPQI